MSDLSKQTKKALQHRFPHSAVTYDEGPGPIATIAPIYPEFGVVEVIEGADELTVNCGNFTHVHLSNYDEGISPEERNQRVVASLIDFLSDVFADRIEFWGSHRGIGGCRRRESQDPGLEFESKGATFTWSGPTEYGRKS